MAEQAEAQRTPIPVIADGEDTFIPLWEYNISLRQTLTALGGIASYAFLIKLTSLILPISTVFAMILWSWVIIASLALAFIPKDGAPLEEYLSAKMQFLLSERKFILMDSKEDFFDIDATDWDEVERRQWK